MDYLNIALSKGRLGEKGYKLFKKIGLDCAAFEEDSRKLIFENKEKKIRYVLVKPSDVPVYVERGAVDIGIVGKDTILEEDRDVYEIIDLKYGKCKFSVASTNKDLPPLSSNLRIATKYPNVAKKYFKDKGYSVDIIKLNGSVEIAPLVDLSDVIVDIVETGSTLKANGLIVIEDMYDLSARLISNKVSFKFKNKRIIDIVDKLNSILKEV